MGATWRDAAVRVIEDVLRDNPGLSVEEMRKKLSEAYPFYERRMHPYKVWLKVVKEYMYRYEHGQFPPKSRRAEVEELRAAEVAGQKGLGI